MKASHIAKISTESETPESTIPDPNQLWFADDIDQNDLKNVYGKKDTPQEQKLKKKTILAKMNAVSGDQARLGKFVAIDCEMVGVGPDGTDSALARVSLVNFHGAVLLDCYVKPQEAVTDYRTHVSGIEPKHLESDEALTFKEAQFKVEAIIRGRVLIGHAVYNDLQVLMISHPTLLIRDTSRYKPFRNLAKGRTPGLKMLVKEILGISIQSGSHSSVEDARFTMQLYKSVKLEWEKSLGAKSGLMMKKLAAKETSTSKKKKTVSIKEPDQEAEASDSDQSSEDSGSEDDSSDEE